MKKAKLILSAVAIFAVIDGSYAFKARTSQGLWFGNAPGQLPTTYLTGYKTTTSTAGSLTFATTTSTLPAISTYYTTGL